MIAVTGATGNLGGLVVADLLERGVAPAGIVAVVRSRDRAAHLAAAGVQVRVADYDDPVALVSAFTGVERLLLVSGSEPGRRVGQHGNVIDAAVEAGVRSLAYTSITKAETSGIALAPDHLATEDLLADAPLATTVLRNNWYYENYTAGLESTLSQGQLLSATDGASFNPAARPDLAAAAAGVLTGEGHEGRIYELAGPSVTLAKLAATIAETSGTPVTVVELPAPAYREALLAAGLPAPVAAMLVDADEGIARGDLEVEESDLERLVGRPLIPFAEVVRAAL
ncbi:NAD(P)H-binding protein [Egicoccus halophilus]|uniref:NAD(P)-dependent oxidoreductase n=1 Tax=Egicoccus halophilus TaxID=1670830 RepID=A0A8J3A7V8_9ACTN|nr:NAD(P)H-binding protein [Egicoccus halophilus]GGI03389.1 NAD(P)-dependent oxidoreductase [Egicoccus halophilus]